jgi:GMP synthase-like glutamine amidotransferase
MKAHVLQHVPFEGIGSIASWLEARDADVGATRFYESPALPSISGLDLVIAMGGPMSVHDEGTYPWLAAEKRFLREAVESGIAVLGICLGAQLIASALGAGVRPAKHREIGWFEIEALPAPADALPLPQRATVLHWHGETFDLPEGAVHLARSAVCEHQAFQVGRRAVGLQFHPEATPRSLRALVEHCRDELTPDRYVQSEAELLSQADRHAAPLRDLTARLLDYLCGSAS